MGLWHLWPQKQINILYILKGIEFSPSRSRQAVGQRTASSKHIRSPWTDPPDGMELFWDLCGFTHLPDRGWDGELRLDTQKSINLGQQIMAKTETNQACGWSEQSLKYPLVKLQGCTEMSAGRNISATVSFLQHLGTFNTLRQEFRSVSLL